MAKRSEVGGGSGKLRMRNVRFGSFKAELKMEKVRIAILGASGYTGAEAGLLELTNIIIDSKSGASGAGRSPKESLLYAELSEGIYSYGITNHRHVSEIEQGLSEIVNSSVTVSFTPHLMPMSRGMQSTIYVQMASGVTIEDLYDTLKTSYEDEYFVKLLKRGDVPHTNHVSGSNYCKMNVFPDRIRGRAIIISVIDNLVKGASGQALQNFNVMFGFPETTGLLYQPLFP